MNRKIRYIITFLLGLVAFFGFSSSVDARSLKVDKYDITVNILENGDVQFQEKITFQADGSYNGVFYNLDYSGFREPTDVTAFLETGSGTVEMPQNSTGTSGTYQLTHEGDKLKFKVFTPFSNSRRTVTFQYTIPKLITNYEDTAELNRKVVGTQWEIDQENITVKVNLPGNASKETLRAWGHGAGQNGNVKIADDYKSVTFTAPSNKSGDFVEVHMIFPQTLTPGNTNVVNRKAFDEIVAQEEKLLQQEEGMKTLGSIGVYIGWILLFVNLIFAWVKGFFANRKRLQKVPHVPDHLFEIPEDITPAIMNKAIYGKSTMKDLSATVMDLVRKKILTLSETQPHEIKLVGDVSKLLRHEKLAVKLLFEDVGGGDDTIYLKDIKEYAEDHPKAYYNAATSWLNAVDTAAEKHRVDRFTKGEPEARNYFAGCFVFLLVAATYGLSLLSKNPVLAGLTIIFALVLIPLTLIGGGAAAKRRTLEGEYRYRQWQAFKQMLKDLSPMKRIEDLPSIQLWDHFLVYAISLGVAEHVIKVLKKLIPDQLPDSVFYSSQTGTIYYPIADFNSAFSSSYNSSSSYVNGGSNSGGFGGGFSGGSSGGSGGGSGGGGF